MHRRPEARPKRRTNPPDERADAPVVLPDMPPGATRRALDKAVELGASPRRLAWACMAVVDMLARRMDAARLLEDDRPEAIVFAMRRWCLREAPDSTPEEAAAESRVALSGTPLDLSGPKAARGDRARFFFLAAVDGLVEWSRRRFEGALDHVPFTAAMIDAKGALRAMGEPHDAAEAIVFYVFIDGLAEPMTERRDNPRSRDPISALPRFLRTTGTAAWRWALQNTALDFDTDRDYRERAPEYRERARTYADRAQRIARDGSAEICRAIAVPADRPWRETVRLDCLGKAWSAERCGAGVYGMVPYDVPTREVHLVGRVAASDIDWAYGFESFLIYGEDQWEISLRENARVTLTEVDGERLRPPLVGSSGTAGEYWAHTCPPRVDNPRARAAVPTPIPLPAGFRLVRGAAQGDLFMLTLVRGRHDSIAGYVKVRELTRGSPEWPICAKARGEVAELAGRRLPRALYISNSYLDFDYRSAGLGAVMYAAAAEITASNYRAVLMSNNCASNDRMTSSLAARVWKSRRFAEVAHIIGEVACPKATQEPPRADNPGRRPAPRPIPTPLPLPPGVTVAVEPYEFGLFTIVARKQGLDGYAGSLAVGAWEEPPYWTTCHADKRRVSALARRRKLGICYVANTFVHPTLRNAGLGAALYAIAIALAAREHGAVLVSNYCAGGNSQKTSPDASRVWKSRRLAEVAFVSGQVAYPKPVAKAAKALWQMTRGEFEEALEETGEVRHAGGVYRRLGPPDAPTSRVPDVDFAERDLQDASDRVDEATIRRDYGGGRRDLDVYRAYVESADAPRPVLADQEQAREDWEDCRARQRKLGYPDEGEDDYEDCDQLAESGYDWDELSAARSTPPAKMLAHASGAVELLDGNHRVTLWQERGFHWFPAWVLDARGHRAAVVDALARGERVPPRVLADYPELAAKPRRRP